MNIKLNEKYTLCSDNLNMWIEATCMSKKGREYGKVVSGCHSNLEGALLTYKKRKINALDACTIDALIQGIASADEEIKSFCTSIKGAI